MNLIELNRALRQLRLGGIAAVLETRLHQAQTEAIPPIDFLSCLVSDELTRRSERLLERRIKQAAFRDHQKTKNRNYQEMNNEYRIQGRKDEAAQIAHGHRHERQFALSFCAVVADQVGPTAQRLPSEGFFEHDAPHLPSASSIHPGDVSEKALA